MKATTQVKKWGNSLAIRIPSRVARELGLSSDSLVEITSDGSRATIIPETPQVGTLDELVKAITSENRHTAADWGEPAGKELW